MRISDIEQFAGYIAFNYYKLQIENLPDGTRLFKLEFICSENANEFANCVVFENNNFRYSQVDRIGQPINHK